ncbi:MAG: histidine--tRNA ligase [Oscillospiraceae bacterium]|nr:histidine--tRNA ligase [Oscillospiraceae bacterium]
MGETIKSLKGFQDVLPSDSYKWQFVENLTRETAELFGFREIRFPTVEYTGLFNRSVGDTTDVVQKEMYTFMDKGNRSVTLRPEGTAGTVRAVMQNGMLNDALPLRLSYITSCFRNENPQAGRLREFHQFGIEMFGAQSPSADAEVIGVAHEIFERLGLKNITLEINSIGCPECRKHYHQALKDYFAARKEELCGTCLERLEKNPLRILDCKSPICKEIAKDAPLGLDYLCDECKEHFEGVKQRLNLMGIEYRVNPRIVRGLDYYTKTVFEFVSNDLGAQSTVCGGGRYDGLIETMGGNPTPGLGFGMGLERLLLIMEAQKIEIPQPTACQLYLGSMGEAASLKALELVTALRRDGYYAECDTMNRSVKAQMKYANKIGAKLSAILGDSELESGKLNLKDMATGESMEVGFEELSDKIYEYWKQVAFEEMADEFDDLFAADQFGV